MSKLELSLYFAVIVGVHVLAIPKALQLSNEFQQSSSSLRSLQKGWINDRYVDVSDAQYTFFRQNLPILLGVAMLHLILSQIVKSLFPESPRARVWFNIVFSFVFISYTNGACIVFMAALALINFLLGRLPGPWAPALTWMFNLTILVTNDWYRGYSFRAVFGSSLGWLDGHRGLFPWQNQFNLAVLRMISFNMDSYWQRSGKPLTDREGAQLSWDKHAERCPECRAMPQTSEAQACSWWREKSHLPASAYSLLHYFAYVFYIPLHLAGPIVTFNSFFSHLSRGSLRWSARDRLMYGLRLLATWAVFEVALHYCYIFAMTDAKWYIHKAPLVVAVMSHFALNYIWLKFLVIWRFFRLWALCDGQDPPENMNRCVNNNYSVEGFWRSWHRSFNRWLVRYIYVPLGGRVPSASDNGMVWVGSVLRRVLNIWAVFTFVAFWHERNIRLLTWGWAIAGLYVPELLAKSLFALPALAPVRRSGWYRHLCGVGYALNIVGMELGNLVGYSIGVEGTRALFTKLFADSDNAGAWLVMLGFLFSAVQVMFVLRNREKESQF